jgi:polysaccharide pyruvyl transferase WcaK-like protein
MSEKLYLSGGWGYGNLGDNAILKCTYEQLCEFVHPDQIIVTSFCQNELIENHGIQSVNSIHREFSFSTFSRFKKKILNIPNIIDYRLWRSFNISLLPALRNHLRMISESRAVVLSGGGYFNSAWPGMMKCQFQTIEIAHRLGKPVFICGQTLGPFSPGEPQSALNKSLKKVSAAGCRDKGSLNLVNSISDDANIGFETSDVVNLLQPPPHRTRGDKVVVGVMIQLFRGHDNPNGRSPAGRIRSRSEYTSAVVDGLIKFAQDKPIVLKFISSTSWDLEHCKHVYEEVKNRSTVAATPPTRLHIDEFIRECQSVDMMISTNMHPVIIAATAGRPSIAISYSFKLNDYMRSIGLEEFALKIDDFSSGTLAETAGRLFETMDQSAAIVQQHMPELITKAKANFSPVSKIYS